MRSLAFVRVLLPLSLLGAGSAAPLFAAAASPTPVVRPNYRIESVSAQEFNNQLATRRLSRNTGMMASGSPGAMTAATYVLGSYFWSYCIWRTEADWNANYCEPLNRPVTTNDYMVGFDAYFSGAYGYREAYLWSSTFTPGWWWRLEWRPGYDPFIQNTDVWVIFNTENSGPYPFTEIDGRYLHWVMADYVHTCQANGGNYQQTMAYANEFDSNWSPITAVPYVLQNLCGGGGGGGTPTPTATATGTATSTATPRPTATPQPTLPNQPPSLIGPKGCVASIAPLFSWGAMTGINQYDIFISPGIPGGQTVTGNSFQPSGSLLTAGAVSSWNARAKNSIGPGPTAAPLAFIPGCQVLSTPPVLQAPADGEVVGTTTPTLTWTAIVGATSYEVTITDDTTSASSLLTPTSNSLAVAAGVLKADRSYHWKVRAIALTDKGNLSGVRSFTTTIPIPVDTSLQNPPTGQGPSSAPDSVGCPVSVVSGNMYLSEADLVLPGAGPSLALARTYNSQNVAAGSYGIFGPGWHHSFEATLTLQPSGALLLMQGDGTPLYFLDQDGDGFAEAFVPAGEQSKIQTFDDGTRVRLFRAGGKETYDPQGRLSVVTEPAGMTVWIGRNADGTIHTINDPAGRALTFSYLNGKVSHIAAPGDLETVDYTYGPGGRLDTVTYKDGSGYVFGYDSAYHLQSVTDKAGMLLESHTYYPDGKGQTSSKADGVEKYTLVYGANQTTVTNALGQITTYNFAEVNHTKRVMQITGTCGCAGSVAETSSWSYDAEGRVSSQKDADGKVTTYQYDPDTGDLIAVKDAQQNATVLTYYEDGRVKTVTTPENGRTLYTYGVAGPESITQSLTPTSYRVTKTHYTFYGVPDKITDALGKETTFQYTSGRDLDTITDAMGKITKFTYDAMGRVKTVTDPLNRVTTTTYDDRGRVRRITADDDTYTEFTYDLSGQRTAVKDAAGRSTAYTYDPYGRALEVMDPLKNVTKQAYDAMSHLTSITDAEGRTTRFEYDSLGRMIRTIYPDGAVEALSYDANGRLATRTDRKDVKTSYAYDSLGRLLKKTYSDGSPDATYTYDKMGRMLTAANGTDTLTWTYDLAGRVLTEASALNASTVTYSYDDAGNRQDLKLNGSTVASYFYDDLSRLESIQHGSLTFGFGYDAASQRKSMTYPNGIVTSYTYDNMARLTEVRAAAAGAIKSDASYTYDAVGNRTSKTLPELSETYGYDAISRLTRVTRAAQGQIWSYDYDRVGNRTVESTNGTALQSTYDLRNELRSRQAGGLVPVEGTVSEPANVQVGGQPAQALPGNRFAGQVAVTSSPTDVAVQATDGSGNVTSKTYRFNSSGQAATLDYDANGNLKSKIEGADTWTYEWTVENQLKRVTKNGSEMATFSYDPLGRRVRKVAAGVTHAYLYDGQDILREKLTGSTTATYTYLHGPGIDEPLAREDHASALTYYHADGLGSIVKMTDMAGTIIDRKQYDARGNVEVGSLTGGYAFTGREWDPETGLDYFRARYYDPKVGRFIGEDPIGFAGGANFYAHVASNPTTLTDPSGLDPNNSIVRLRFPPGSPGARMLTPPPDAPPGSPLWKVLLYTLRKLLWAQNPGGMPGPAAMVMVPEQVACQVGPRFLLPPAGSGGAAIVVPEGVTSVAPAANGLGTVFSGGSGGGSGLSPKITSLRVMDPTLPRPPSPGYPNGYANYSNAYGQVVDLTGKTVGKASLWWHIPLW